MCFQSLAVRGNQYRSVLGRARRNTKYTNGLRPSVSVKSLNQRHSQYTSTAADSPSVQLALYLLVHSPDLLSTPLSNLQVEIEMRRSANYIRVAVLWVRKDLLACFGVNIR